MGHRARGSRFIDWPMQRRTESGPPARFTRCAGLRRLVAPRLGLLRSIRILIRTGRRIRCCRSMRCAAIAICRRLPFGGGHPILRLVEGNAAIARINCLTAPTPTLRAPLHETGAWRLVSHLSLGHLLVVGGAAGASALKEVLRLYDLRDSAETRAAIDGLLSVSAQAGVARVAGARAGAFCRGLDVTMEFDPRLWHSSGLCLLAAVLERFLALHATVNSFVRSTAVLRGMPGRAAAWPARAGARTLL